MEGRAPPRPKMTHKLSLGTPLTAFPERPASRKERKERLLQGVHDRSGTSKHVRLTLIVEMGLGALARTP